MIHHLTDKIEKNRSSIVQVREYDLDDAEIAVISFGCSARSARAAVREARRRG
ncbi:MAG TPA: 2-oxoacid:acceptor oxidoreductase subunit alpha, partial [Synergistaceae bacterium]|nr:2-oxoacid:acceptor oxidoreductase subunit alpha [Synergistaceae bacterium]